MSHAEPTPPLNTAAILVVDDESANVKLLQALLAQAGYLNVVGLLDPRQVEDTVATTAFNLIVLDINMPYLDGFEVMARLRARFGTRLPPVLVLTAQHDREFRLRALGNGARDFVSKPFDTAELLARVRNLLEVHEYQTFLRDSNKVLEKLVRERTTELHDTRLQVVRRLGRAAEYRDNETGLHIIRMSKTSALIAQAAGCTPEHCDLLLNASPMHDIGKIGIPDHILLKPGKLDADEWATMQKHVAIGAEILSGEASELLRMAHEIALSHHEKWDGTGYPRNLSWTACGVRPVGRRARRNERGIASYSDELQRSPAPNRACSAGRSGPHPQGEARINQKYQYQHTLAYALQRSTDVSRVTRMDCAAMRSRTPGGWSHWPTCSTRSPRNARTNPRGRSTPQRPIFATKAASISIPRSPRFFSTCCRRSSR